MKKKKWQLKNFFRNCKPAVHNLGQHIPILKWVHHTMVLISHVKIVLHQSPRVILELCMYQGNFIVRMSGCWSMWRLQTIVIQQKKHPNYFMPCLSTWTKCKETKLRREVIPKREEERTKSAQLYSHCTTAVNRVNVDNRSPADILLI